MDNSKYVFEMKENVPVRTSDASKGHEVVVYAEQVLKEMGKNNSTGKYDKVVQGVRSLLGQSLLDGEKLKNAVRQEVERLLKKYNPNDMRTVDDIVTVNESDFVSSHMKNPKGYGHWIFGIGSKNMSDWFETTGTYAEAKKRAIEEAKKKGKTTVYTMG